MYNEVCTWVHESCILLSDEICFLLWYIPIVSGDVLQLDSVGAGKSLERSLDHLNDLVVSLCLVCTGQAAYRVRRVGGNADILQRAVGQDALEFLWWCH